MPNITLSVEDDVIRKVRKLAVDRRTTLTELVRTYLKRLAAEDTLQRELAANELEAGFRQYSRAIGQRTWTRDELHER
jgi:3-methyladenine DNA glycosylase AlkD